MAGLAVNSNIEYLFIVCVWGYWLGLHWGRELQVWVFVSEPISSSVVTTLVTIPSIKESAAARGGLAQWHWKGIWVLLRVISIFLVARLATRYIESVIYIIFLDIIRESITIIIEFNSV